LTKGFVHNFRKIEHHDVLSSGIFADEFPDKYHRELMKQDLITLQEAVKVYMVKVTAEFHC
jgi:hypothetical protein